MSAAILADVAAQPVTGVEHTRRLVGRQLAFLGHFVVFTMVVVLLLFVAGLNVAVITALGWGIGLTAHGFFAVAAPMMRPTLEHHTARVIAPAPARGPDAHALEELSAAIAHEIRNPITAAKSLVQQMGEDPSSARNAEYAAVAVEQLDRVERSIAHLLRYARDESLQLTPTSIDDVVRAAVEGLRDRVARAGVSLVVSADPTGTMRADPEKLRRVVENLVTNALDALTDAGTEGPCIDVACGTSLAGDAIWVSVRDNGPGIAPEALPRIFQPFFTSKEGGTGLGLALSKKTVEAHGGTLEAMPLPSGGTELRFTLPRGAPAPRELPA